MPSLTLEAAIAATAAAGAAFDAAWESRRPVDAARGGLACRAGCAACCHQHVAVLPIEAVAIAGQLIPGDQAGAALRERVGATARRIAGMDAAARRWADIACPFLGDGGACAIYAARPLRCRGLHSRDAAHCARIAMRRESDDTIFPLAPLQLADAALAGLAEAAQSAGLPHATLELTRAVAALLKDPARIEAVLTGADRLDEARMPTDLAHGSASVAKR